MIFRTPIILHDTIIHCEFISMQASTQRVCWFLLITVATGKHSPDMRVPSGRSVPDQLRSKSVIRRCLIAGLHPAFSVTRLF